ncbi:thioredoxin family protein [Agromyces sp. SYSU T0242]|uniref:thioredoxin family protein n=1 Tax=Agromyces litoreus TaxID=3158561 RepID=UPI0033985865
MPARPVRSTGAAALLVAALALTGCATAGTAADDTTPAAAPTAEAPEHDAADMADDAETDDALDDAADDAADAVAAGAYLDYEDGLIEATPGDKVLFFHATWCPNCRALDEQLRAEGAPDGLTVFKVDYDSRTDLRQKYGVTMQTTVVYVDDAGEKLSSEVLYQEPSIDALLAAAP